MNRMATIGLASAIIAGCTGDPAIEPARVQGEMPMVELSPAHEVNLVEEPPLDRTSAITGATLIDGRGAPPVPNAVVVIRGTRILAAGPRGAVEIPAGAEIIDATGQTVLPGLVDAHFHLDRDVQLPALYLQHGVTSVRDPGAWIDAYDATQALGAPLPRLFLTGPHLDAPPPAYPADSLLVRDPEEARVAVARLAAEGASAIKIYYRLPLGTVQAVIQAAHAHRLVTTAHLELVDARDAIRAGLDGVEHVTSFGVALAKLHEAEAYRQAVLADNAARGPGRYALFSHLEADSPAERELIALLVARRTFVSPTLAIFERRAGDPGTNEEEVRGFSNMLAFVGRAHKKGVRIVIGSHSAVPHAERGFAYAHEMELLAEAGLSPAAILEAATLETARFLHIDDRLGTIEPGKIADIVLVQGNPIDHLGAMRDVRRVMLNGVWLDAHAAHRE